MPGGATGPNGPAAILDLVVWRTRRLAAAGFDTGRAGSLAAEHRFDPHALLELGDRHCPPDLAIRFLAPLDEVVGQHAC